MSEALPYVTLEELLEDPDLLKPPTHIVPKLVWRNRVTMLAAREKGGKSTLAGAAAASVSRGASFLGDETLGGNVLIVALEEHPQEFVSRLVKFGADPKRVAFVQGDGESLVKQIRDAAAKWEPVFIVVDTLGAFANHISSKALEPNDSQGWTAVMEELTSIAREFAAMLILHHSNKSDGRYRDSTAIGANVDVILEMYGEDAEPRKIKGKGRFFIPELRIKLNATGDAFEVLESQADFDERVLAWIATHPRCTMRDLAEGVGGKTTDISASRDRLLKTLRIANVGSDAKHAYMAMKKGS